MPQTKQREAILDEVRRIAFTFLKGPNVSIHLFGSWAKGKECRSSDIDLGILYEKPLPTGTLAKLRLAFEESTLPYRVDVVDLTKTDAKFRENALKEAVQWKDWNSE